ncbi:MAG: sugar phosphate isomerase/epimerase [Chloroflexi bacterium]|nr:sugar phosphate isomerase/epimerase [Chloroflexota bacterium]MCL5275903.1 sugar phosphate isomerase/epimerase [Chloroflexota bacterium]
MPDPTRVKRFGTTFRLGSTSYVYPDDVLPNVQRLAQAGDVDDIELLLFEVDDGPSNLPDDRTLAALIDLAAAHRLTYTVHLPLDLRLSANGTTQHASLVKAERVIKTTLPLTPYAYVFHLDASDIETSGWVERSLSALERLIAWVPQPELLAVENVEAWDPARLEPILKALPISRTTDIGHLWKMRRDPLTVLDGWLPRTRVIHLHGLGERDHQSLALMPAEQLDPVIDRLRNYYGVLTLEVFSTSDFFDSRAALLESVKRVGRG